MCTHCSKQELVSRAAGVFSCGGATVLGGKHLLLALREAWSSRWHLGRTALGCTL